MVVVLFALAVLLLVAFLAVLVVLLVVNLVALGGIGRDLIRHRHLLRVDERGARIPKDGCDTCVAEASAPEPDALTDR